MSPLEVVYAGIWLAFLVGIVTYVLATLWEAR